ncbi:uncharacterized protein [Leptinotarsa decemlineata]|uniref:uncharacterized protein n=1 Tax=Leptinotarsa decemlineata TaxID=7539 RepID=UPI003D30AB04
MEEYGDDYETILYDRFYMPTKNDVVNVSKKKFKKDFGDRTGSCMLEKLEETLTKHEENNNVLYNISRFREDCAVAICTESTESRIKNQDNDIMFLYASGNCDVYDHKVYFFVTQTAAGGLPIGCILRTVKNLICLM